MEQLGNLLSQSNPLNSVKTADYEKSLKNMEARQTILRQEIIKLYQSARRELPDDDAIEFEAQLAYSELAEIPDSDLSSAFDAAKVEAGAFLPSNGLIVKSYRATKENAFEQAAKATRERNTNFWLNYKPQEEITAEERELMAQQARNISEGLKE